MGCYYHICPCQEARPSLIDQDIERENKKREMNDMQRKYNKGIDTKFKKCGSVIGRKNSKPRT